MGNGQHNTPQKPEWPAIDAPRREKKPPLFLLSRKNRLVGGVFGGIADKLCKRRAAAVLTAWLLRLCWLAVLVGLQTFARGRLSSTLLFCAVVTPYLLVMLLLHEDSNEKLMPDPNMENKH